jgi:hypothetical protein
MEIIYDKSIEDGVRIEINKYLSPFVWLGPTWCHELRISMLAADEGRAAIRTGIKYEYRRASMDFFSGWLTESDYAKGLHVVHDLLHIANSVYVDFAETAITNLAGDEKHTNGFLMEESRMRCESMTQDLAKAIYDRFRFRFEFDN